MQTTRPVVISMRLPQRKREPPEANGQPAWMDPQRCERPAGRGGSQAVGIRVHRFSRFRCGPASLHSGEHTRCVGGIAARSKL